MFGYVTDRHWTDVGNLEAYLRAHWEVLDRQVEVEIEGFEVSDGVWLGTGAELSPDAHVVGPCVHRREQPGRGRSQHLRPHAFWAAASW